MKKMTVLLLTLCLLLTLTACGSSSKNTAGIYREEAAAEAPMMAADNSIALKGNGESGSTALPENRKWIITVDMNVETENLEELQAALDEKISALDGYVEDQSTHNGSAYSTRRYRSASWTVRIPAEKVDQFTEDVAGIANVVSNNLRREDITLQYVATESRVLALQTEETRLLELLAQAETMADLLEIEARLTDVRYELENYASQLRLYDNQVDYATIYLYIEEVQQYTPMEEPSLWERITDGFKDSLEGLGESLENLLVFLIVATPYLVVYGGIGTVVFLLIRKITRNHETRHKEKKPYFPKNKKPASEQEQ